MANSFIPGSRKEGKYIFYALKRIIYIRAERSRAVQLDMVL